jgi:hypothetical protein
MNKSSLIFGFGSLPRCCGMSEVGGFSYTPFNNPRGLKNQVAHLHTHLDRTSPVFVSTFNNTERCQKAYEYLTANYNLLYQSPLVTNRIHGSKIFICVFEKKEK